MVGRAPAEHVTFGTLTSLGHQQTIGFDYLRIGLSLAVLIIHAIAICGGAANDWLEHEALPLKHLILPAFFALSGYLVAGSLFRNSIPQFVALRIIRIVPALAFEVILTAIVLGSIYTTLPLKVYWTNPEFLQYLMNALGVIHFTLPGVFDGKFVNAQLWTIPYELECYALLVGVTMLGFMRRPVLFFVTVIALTFLCMARSHSDVAIGTNVAGRTLVLAFAYGVIIYLYRDIIPASSILCATSLVISVIMLLHPATEYFAAALIAYVTVYIGVMKLPKVPLGDLSYGVFLYHFPVAQTIREVSGQTISWWMLAIVTVAVSGSLAMFSWKVIEQPILLRKKSVLRIIADMQNDIASSIQSKRNLLWLWTMLVRRQSLEYQRLPSGPTDSPGDNRANDSAIVVSTLRRPDAPSPDGVSV